jgi:SnoaL-like domain
VERCRSCDEHAVVKVIAEYSRLPDDRELEELPSLFDDELELRFHDGRYLSWTRCRGRARAARPGGPFGIATSRRMFGSGPTMTSAPERAQIGI